jgi:hypothetical protein
MSEKFEITNLLGNDVSRVLPGVDIDLIWKERNNFCRNIGRYPDYVLIHVCNKPSILEEAQKANIYELMCPTIHRCFGMKVIWTTDIAENDVICTYSGR